MAQYQTRTTYSIFYLIVQVFAISEHWLHHELMELRNTYQHAHVTVAKELWASYRSELSSRALPRTRQLVQKRREDMVTGFAAGW